MRAGTESEQELVVEREDAARGGAPGSMTEDPGASDRGGSTGHDGLRPRTVRPSTTGSIGLLLAGRYRLVERRGRDGDSSLWDAHDTQLERPVIVRVVSGRAVPAALEGARVAAGRPAPGLTRILDTGSARATDGTMLGWVVEERPAGDRLDDVVQTAPMDTARARAVVGQASLVLADAARGGFHHRRLTPSSLHVSGKQVVVSGLVVAAAAAGAPAADEASALAEDGRGLVSLLYTALTGRWPGDGEVDEDGALQPLVPLRELVPDVPPGIDSLVTSVLSGSGGDRVTPDVLGELLLGDGGRAPASAAPAEAGTTAADIVLPDTRQVPAQDAHPGAPAAPPPAVPGGGAGPAGGAVERVADEAVDGGGPTQRPPLREATGSSSRGARRAAREARAARGSSPVDDHRPAAPADDDPVDVARADDGPAGPLPREDAHGARDARAALTSAAGAAGAVASTALTRSREAVRAAVARPPAHRSTGPARRAVGGPAAPDGDPGDPAERPTDRSVGPSGTGSLPLVETIPGDHREGGPSHLRGPVVIAALALVAVVVVLAAFLAFRQVPTLQSVRDAVLGDDATITSTLPSAPGGTPDDEAAPDTPPAVVANVSALDPQGDGNENGGAAENVVDGDPATSWTSETYASAALGNLKEGVGLDLELESEATVREVELTVEGTGGEIEVRTSPDGSFADSSVVATAPLDGVTTVAVDPAVTTSHVILWFTELPSTGGSFRADVSDVTLG